MSPAIITVDGLGKAYHVGAEAVYRDRVSLRAGYSHLPGYGGVQASEYNGPMIGFGFSSARLAFDVARQITATGLLAEEPPTYVGLRYAF